MPLTPVWAAGSSTPYPLYVGAIGGYGSTTWEGLVPSTSTRAQSEVLNMATPIEVREGGGIWGFLLGYELNPYFAIEANYVKYQESEISFAYKEEYVISFFENDHPGQAKFTTNTETLSLMGKIMLFVPNTKLRVYSSAGLARLHRQDILLSDWRTTPTFGVGFNYPLSERVMGGIDGNYTAGYGESRVTPADTYYPFLYSFSVRLAYRF
jgi:hypothetical protein